MALPPPVLRAFMHGTFCVSHTLVLVSTNSIRKRMQLRGTITVFAM